MLTIWEGIHSRFVCHGGCTNHVHHKHSTGMFSRVACIHVTQVRTSKIHIRHREHNEVKRDERMMRLAEQRGVRGTDHWQ